MRPDNIRFKLSRQSAGEEYLLPGLRKAEAGDVTIGQRDLITNTAIGRGITLSNDNKNRNSEFDLITIVGSGPPGWDIEIYNNEELVNFGVVPNDGQYVFEDVVLNYGNNEVKILFFGPQGQVREELRTYNAGGNMLPEGQFRYNAGILDSDRPFILLDNSPRTEPRGTVKTLNTSYGVNRWLTLLGNYTEIPNADKSREYATLGAAASTPIGLFEGEAYREVAGGHAFNLSYITKFLGFRANLNAAVYKDFESELSGFGTNRKTFETKAQLNRNIKLFTLPLGLRFNTIHTERKSGLKTTDVDFTQTFSRGGIRLSHNTSTRLADNAHERTTGGLTTTVREGPWQLRGGINYNMYPETELASGNAEIRYKTEDGFQAALNLSHNFTTSDYRIGTQAGYDFKTFLGTAEAAYIRDGGFEFILRATTSLHPYTNDDGYEFSSASRRQYAPVRARVFLDENADGEFNEGEQPIEGAQLRIGGGKTREGTDKDGYIIANAPGDTITNVYVDTPSLKDPYYIPAYEGFSTVPIQGKMIDAVFPVVETGSIEGTVYRQSNRKAVAGLILNLVDIASNEKIMSVETGFDGFYVFEFVKPGTYRVETDETHLVDLVENSASVAPGDLYVYGHDIYINDEDFIGGENMDIQESAAEPMGPELPADLEPAAGESAENQNTAPEQENTEPSNNFDVSLHDPRFKSHKDKLRFMINASEPVDYEILPASTQSSIDILIKQALISQQQDLRIEKDGREYDCKFSQTPDGVKISISADEPLGIQYSSLLPATTAEDNRLLIDLKPMLAQ